MITAKQGKIHIEGFRSEVRADFVAIADTLMEEDVLTAEEMHEAIKELFGEA